MLFGQEMDRDNQVRSRQRNRNEQSEWIPFLMPPIKSKK